MLPLTVGTVCVFMCLAASSLTLILSIFSIYFMMCSGSETAKEEGKQQVSTDIEHKPCAYVGSDTQAFIPAFIHHS